MDLSACTACVLVSLNPFVHQKKYGIPSLLLKCVIDKDTELAQVTDPYYISKVWQIQVGSISSGCSLISLDSPAWFSPRKELRGTFLQFSCREEAFVIDRERYF